MFVPSTGPPQVPHSAQISESLEIMPIVSLEVPPNLPAEWSQVSACREAIPQHPKPQIVFRRGSRVCRRCGLKIRARAFMEKGCVESEISPGIACVDSWECSTTTLHPKHRTLHWVIVAYIYIYTYIYTYICVYFSLSLSLSLSLSCQPRCT